MTDRELILREMYAGTAGSLGYLILVVDEERERADQAEALAVALRESSLRVGSYVDKIVRQRQIEDRLFA